MALGRLGQMEAVPHLKEIIEGNEDEKIKASAIYGLGAVDDKSVSDLLIRRFEEENGSLAIEYARVLGRVRKEKSAAPKMMEKIRKIGNRRDGFNGAKKIVLFEMLGELEDPRVIPELKEFLKSDDLLDMESSAKALLKLGDIDSFKVALDKADGLGKEYMGKRLRRAYFEITGREYPQ